MHRVIHALSATFLCTAIGCGQNDSSGSGGSAGSSSISGSGGCTRPSISITDSSGEEQTITGPCEAYFVGITEADCPQSVEGIGPAAGEDGDLSVLRIVAGPADVPTLSVEFYQGEDKVIPEKVELVWFFDTFPLIKTSMDKLSWSTGLPYVSPNITTPNGLLVYQGTITTAVPEGTSFYVGLRQRIITDMSGKETRTAVMACPNMKPTNFYRGDTHSSPGEIIWHDMAAEGITSTPCIGAFVGSAL